MPIKQPSQTIWMRILCQSLVLCFLFLFIAIVPVTLSACGGLTEAAQYIEAASDGHILKLNLTCQKVYAPQLPDQGSPYTSFESSDNLDQLMDKIKQNNSDLELSFDRITDQQFAIWVHQDEITAFYTISKYVSQDQTERYLFSASVLRLEETNKLVTAASQTSIVFPYDLVEPLRESSLGYGQAIETTVSAAQFTQFYEQFPAYRVESLDDGFVLHTASTDQQPPLRFQFEDNHLIITLALATMPKDLATVGGIMITSADLENYRTTKEFEKIYAETYDPDQIVETMTDEAILNELIANAVLYLEAEKQGLAVSDEEVDQYLDTLKTYFANNKDADVISLLREFVSGKGMTLNDYIDALKPRYKQQMSFGQLKAKYITDTKTVEEYEMKLNQFKADLVSQYQSEITIK